VLKLFVGSTATTFQTNLAVDYPGIGFDICDKFTLYTKAKRLSEKCKALRKHNSKNSKATELSSFLPASFMAPETKSPNDAGSEAAPLSHIKRVANRVLAENKALKRNLVHMMNYTLMLSVLRKR